VGVAKLSKVTIISPRSDYSRVATALAQFEAFHPLEAKEPSFDPAMEELAVKAVRLFAQADQAAKELNLQLSPGAMDVVFRGVKIPVTDFDAESWDEVLRKAESQLTPVVEEVRDQRALLQKAVKDLADASALREALKSVSGLQVNIGRLSAMKSMATALVVVDGTVVGELKASLPDTIFVSTEISAAQTLVLIAAQASDQQRVEKALKALGVKPLSIPPSLPQTPADAYRALDEQVASAERERDSITSRLEEIASKDGAALLAGRELTEAAKEMLDQVRVSGPMKWFAMISGYIPRKREAEFKQRFGEWVVETAPIEEDHGEDVPTLMENPLPLRTFTIITTQQGTPRHGEVDPTPLIALVFPIFYGLMFGDLGHGIILSLFGLLIRQRATGSLRYWGNLLLTAGISASVFGVIFGEFFGLSAYDFIRIPAVIEILNRSGAVPTPNTVNIEWVMAIAIIIGILHITTGMGLSIYESVKEHETVELLANKLPTLTMYLSGVAFGIAFIGAGFSFNVLKTSAPAPLLGVPNNLLGGLSLAILFPSMLVILFGKAIAVKVGKAEGTLAGALGEGGLEVFERIPQFLSNTISYVRLAIMLLVHAVLLLIVNEFFPITNPVTVAPWVILNILVISFEALIVYVQDLRLHIYEFFTKFYTGTGTPFKAIVSRKPRARINWR
jgi:V/A-type H+/Na+-transporting ATPase subunit I